MSLEERINKTRETHQKEWGSEDWIINDKDYCGKRLLLKKGYQCSIHYHEIKKETFYVNKGLVLIKLNDEIYLMTPGQSLEIKPGERHRFIGITDAEIIEFSTYHMEEDSHRDKENLSGKVPDDVFNSYLTKYSAKIAEHAE